MNLQKQTSSNFYQQNKNDCLDGKNISIKYYHDSHTGIKNQTWFSSQQNITQKQKLFLDENIIRNKKLSKQIEEQIEIQEHQQQNNNDDFEEEFTSEESLDYVQERYFQPAETICYQCLKVGHQISGCEEQTRCRFCLGRHIKNFCTQNFNCCFLCGEKDHQKIACPYQNSQRCNLCNKRNHQSYQCTYMQLDADRLINLREIDYAKCIKCNLQGHLNCAQDFQQQIPNLRTIQKEIKQRSNSRNDNKKFYRDEQIRQRNYGRNDESRSRSNSRYKNYNQNRSKSRNNDYRYNDRKFNDGRQNQRNYYR